MMQTRTFPYLLAAVIALVTVTAYWPALHTAFVWDDVLYVAENPAVQKLDLQTVQWAFTSFYAGNWHPLTWLSHAFDVQLWGFKPWGHHLGNILLHAANTVVVYFLTLRLIRLAKDGSGLEGVPGRSPDWAAVVSAGTTSLLFGLHPVHVESVAWIAERKDLLCALFFLLSVFVYLTPHRQDKACDAYGDKERSFSSPSYWASFGFFLLALLSKPMAVTLPVILLILDWYPLGRNGSPAARWRVLLEKAPFLVCSIASSIITIIAQSSAGTVHSRAVTPITTRIIVGAHSLIVYLQKIVFPWKLSPLYPYPRGAELFSAAYILTLGLLIVIIGTCIVSACRRKHTLFLAVWGCYVVTLLPVLGIIQVGWQAMADRYLYVPGIGLFILFGLAAGYMYDRLGPNPRRQRNLRSLLAVPVITAAVILGVLTSLQIRIWSDGITLWNHVIQTQPASAMAFNNRGTALAAGGQAQAAIADYERAIALDPGYFEVFNNIGIEYGKLGMLDKAIEAFDRCLALSPSYVDASVNRGTAYTLLGNGSKAMDDFNAAIRFNPRLAPAYVNRGKLLGSLGDLARARMDFQTACDLGNEEACEILRSLNGH